MNSQMSNARGSLYNSALPEIIKVVLITLVNKDFVP